MSRTLPGRRLLASCLCLALSFSSVQPAFSQVKYVPPVAAAPAVSGAAALNQPLRLGAPAGVLSAPPFTALPNAFPSLAAAPSPSEAAPAQAMPHGIPSSPAAALAPPTALAAAAEPLPVRAEAALPGSLQSLGGSASARGESAAAREQASRLGESLAAAAGSVGGLRDGLDRGYDLASPSRDGEAVAPPGGSSDGIEPSLPRAASTSGARAGAPQPPAPRASRRRPSVDKGKLLNRVFLVLGLGLFGEMIWRIGPGVLVSDLAAVGWRLPLVVVPFAATMALDSFGWWLSIPKPRGSIGFLKLLYLRTGSNAIGETTPSFSLMGDIARTNALVHAGVESTAAVASVIISKTAESIAQLLVIAAGMILVSVSVPQVHRYVIPAWGGVLVAAAAFSGLLLLQRRHGLMRPLLGLVEKIPFLRPWAARYEQWALKTDALVKTLSGNPLAFGGAAAAYFMRFFSGACETWAILAILGLPSSLSSAIIIDTLLNIAVGVSGFIPAGLGTMEAALMIIFPWFGMSAAGAVSFAMLKRVRQLAWTALGFALYGQMSRRSPVE